MPKVNLKVPKRSGFDKSHSRLMSFKCGTLVPIMVDEVIPNTKVHLRELISAQLPPLATDAFMRVNLKVEAFFVPMRLLYAGFEKWITKDKIYDPTSAEDKSVLTPILYVKPTEIQAGFNGTLADYLGARTVSSSLVVPANLPTNIYPFLAYHKIYDDWYRNTLVQNSVFSSSISDDGTVMLYNLPHVSLTESNTPSFYLSDKFADGVELNELRQRNFGFDYFTGAMPNAQLGDAQKITFSTSGATGEFTIAALRAANSLQQFAERNQMAGLRLQDFVKANYGANLSNGVAQRTLCLGSAEIPVYSKGIYQNGNQNESDTNNPFPSVAAKYGDAMANGELNLISDFVAEEPGYIMVLASLVPIAAYSSGIDRMFIRYNTQNSQTDMATPILQNVGNQPIYRGELTGDLNIGGAGIFGYTDRYADFKQKQSTIHSILRDGYALDAFALQRSVSGSVTISDAFLQIPTDYLDQVCATSESVSEYGVWVNVFNDYKVSMPLAAYSIPSLQDPAYEHGVDVPVEIGGSRF